MQFHGNSMVNKDYTVFTYITMDTSSKGTAPPDEGSNNGAFCSSVSKDLVISPHFFVLKIIIITELHSKQAPIKDRINFWLENIITLNSNVGIHVWTNSTPSRLHENLSLSAYVYVHVYA